jgi:hypothetical protein
MEATLRQLRIIWIALFAAIFVYGGAASRAAVRQAPDPMVFHAIVGLAVLEVLALFVLRRKYVLQAAPLLSNEGEKATAIARWRTGHIIVWSLSLSVGLYGVVLRFIGFDFRQVSIFFIAGIALMLFLVPRRPS